MKRFLAARLLPLGLVLVAAMLSSALTCTIGFGSPQPTPFGLNIAWFGQLNYYYCVPASIQMWAFFDGAKVSQNTIAAFVGAVPPDGTPAANVAPGVNHFTATHDAFFEDAFVTDPGDFFSMQITSINNARPLIAVFNEQHVVVVSGGSWHEDNTTGWNVWDTVAYQDPAAGPAELTGGEWMDNITAMVIGESATAESGAYLAEYGPTVSVRGSTYHVPLQD